MNKIVYDYKGQTLVMLLVYMTVAIAIVSAAVVALIVNSTSGNKQVSAQSAYLVAESGIENALMRLLRNPEYSGEVVQVNSGESVVTVTGIEPKIVTSVGKLGNFTRTIEAEISFTGNELRVIKWKEKM